MPTTAQAEQASEAVTETVVLPSHHAAYLHNPPPRYPPESRALGEQGRVVLAVHISAEGEPIEVRVKQSSNYDRLDEAAATAVEHWKFVPGRRNGKPQDMWYAVPLRFTARPA